MIYCQENNLLSVRFGLENSLPKMGEGMKKEYICICIRICSCICIYMPRQLNCLGPTESGQLQMEGARTERLLWNRCAAQFVVGERGRRGSPARCGPAGSGLPGTSVGPPWPAQLAGPVWHCTRSSSPWGGSAACAWGTMRLSQPSTRWASARPRRVCRAAFG